MDPVQIWAALAAALLVAYAVIAERHGWLNDPTTSDDTDDDKD